MLAVAMNFGAWFASDRIAIAAMRGQEVDERSGGALYGRAQHGMQASFRRPGARSRVPNLYLAGGSAHPGAGVPMAAMSGRLAAAALLEDRGRA